MLAQKKTWPKRAIQKWPKLLARRPKKSNFFDEKMKKKGKKILLASHFFCWFSLSVKLQKAKWPNSIFFLIIEKKTIFSLASQFFIFTKKPFFTGFILKKRAN